MSVIQLKPRLYMWIEGHGRFEISQFYTDWSRNEIPRATVVLAVGRRAFDGRTAAKIHSSVQSMRKSIKAKVYFTGNGQWDDKEDWPDSETMIFEGRMLGVGFQKSNGKISFVANLTHWLADLNYSSALSSTSHPTSPTDLTFSAISSSKISTGVLAGLPNGIAWTAEANVITSGNVREDLWAKAIKPYFCTLARAEHVRLSTDLRNCLGDKDGDNTQALEALKRIEGVIKNDDCSKELSCYTPPLSMELSETIPDSVTTAIATAITSESIQTIAHNTLWGKLIGSYASAFMFSVIPLVDKALVVPFTPGLRSTYCKEIVADDHGHVKMNMTIPRPIRASVVQFGRHSKSNVISGERDGVSIVGVGGCFAPDDAELTDGMIHFIRAPTWLQNVTAVGYSALRTLGLKAKRGTSSTTTPIATALPELRGDKKGVSTAETIRDVSEVLNGFAHASYAAEALRGRAAIVAGKLRFDIAPGSTIKIEGTSEKFLAEDDQIGQAMIGSVLRVSIGIDSEEGRAGTAFHIDHIRTEEENKQDATSVDNHPLYRTQFLGAPLVDELSFPNEDCCE